MQTVLYQVTNTAKMFGLILINIRDKYSKNTPDYYRLDALVQTAFDMWTAYKGTNAKDTGNCDRLLSLGNN
jgi:hypothetical protein